MVYNATDGDQLWLDFGGHFMLPTTAVGAYEFTGGTVRFPDAAGTASIENVLGDLGRVEIDFDGAIRYRARARTPGASFGADRAPLNYRSPSGVGFCPFAIARPS
jgi:hypothetical protein